MAAQNRCVLNWLPKLHCRPAHSASQHTTMITTGVSLSTLLLITALVVVCFVLAVVCWFYPAAAAPAAAAPTCVCMCVEPICRLCPHPLNHQQLTHGHNIVGPKYVPLARQELSSKECRADPELACCCGATAAAAAIWCQLSFGKGDQSHGGPCPATAAAAGAAAGAANHCTCDAATPCRIDHLDAFLCCCNVWKRAREGQQMSITQR